MDDISHSECFNRKQLQHLSVNCNCNTRHFCTNMTAIPHALQRPATAANGNLSGKTFS